MRIYKDDFKYLVWGIIIALIFLLVIIHSFFLHHSENLACKSIGFDKETYNSDLSYCKDINGNLHYVEFYNCGFFGNHCQVRKITVGEVEVKP
jgi:hypothetical protein